MPEVDTGASFLSSLKKKKIFGVYISTPPKEMGSHFTVRGAVKIGFRRKLHFVNIKLQTRFEYKISGKRIKA